MTKKSEADYSISNLLATLKRFAEAWPKIERAAELFAKEGRSKLAERTRKLLEGLPG